MAAFARMPTIRATPVGIAPYLLIFAILVLVAAAMLRQPHVALFEPIDCQMVKSNLSSETDQARRAQLRTDLRECLRQGTFKYYEVIDLFG